MKLLVTVDTFYPCKDGVQNITQQHLERFAKNGYQVTVVSAKKEGFKDYEIYKSMKIYRKNLNTKFGIHYGEINEYRRLIQDLSLENDLMVNVCLQSATTDLLLKIIDSIKIPKILYLHGRFDFSFNLYNTNKTYINLFKNLYLNIRWGLFYKSNKNNILKYNKIINIFEMDEATHFLHKLGKNVEILHNFTEAFNIDDNIKKEDYVVCLSNFSGLKNQNDVIDVFYTMNLDNNYKLLLIGNEKNKYSSMLEKKAKCLYGEHQNRILFKYALSKKEIYELLKKSKVFLFTSKVEKFPIVLLEALLMKVVFVSTNIGCVRYLPGGLTVDSKEDMVWWARELILNDSLRDLYANAGFNYVNEHFNFEIENNKFKTIIEEVLHCHEK